MRLVICNGDQDVGRRILSFALNLPKLRVLACERILGKSVNLPNRLGFEEKTTVLVHNTVVPIACREEYPFLVAAIESMVKTDRRVVFDTAVFCFQTKIRIWVTN